MGKTSDKRERLIDAAKRLIHQRGFHRTTLAEIAKESGVPLGNVYYYFKTKEDICGAVIEERKKAISRTLDLCCRQDDPKTALKRFVNHTMRESREIAELGCPDAGLFQELDRTASQLAAEADKCVVSITEWAADQFRMLGYRNAKKMGFEFNARLQGIMMVGHALHDPRSIRRHMAALCDWIDHLEDQRVPAQIA